MAYKKHHMSRRKSRRKQSKRKQLKRVRKTKRAKSKTRKLRGGNDVKAKLAEITDMSTLKSLAKAKGIKASGQGVNKESLRQALSDQFMTPEEIDDVLKSITLSRQKFGPKSTSQSPTINAINTVATRVTRAMNGIVAKRPITATEEAALLTAEEEARAKEKAELALKQLKLKGDALVGDDGFMVILDDEKAPYTGRVPIRKKFVWIRPGLPGGRTEAPRGWTAADVENHNQSFIESLKDMVKYRDDDQRLAAGLFEQAIVRYISTYMNALPIGSLERPPYKPEHTRNRQEFILTVIQEVGTAEGKKRSQQINKDTGRRFGGYENLTQGEQRELPILVDKFVYNLIPWGAFEGESGVLSRIS